jgi:hypothetical protein
LVARGTDPSAFQLTGLRYNGDTTSSYAGHELYSNVAASSAASYGEANVSVMRLGWVSGGNSVANNFSSMIVDILEPFSSTKNTTFKAIGGMVDAGGRIAQLHSGLYNKTDSITTATIDANGDNFVAGSRFSIYGIKG